jgi:glycosyltransferase involved in cell wall biosynthesis
MRFSLIVCTLDRRDELAELFDSLVRQDRDDFEVILVDQNVDDRLVEIVDRYKAHFTNPSRSLRYSEEPDSSSLDPGLRSTSDTGLAGNLQSSKPALCHIRMTGTGLSRARNLGISHATGELIGFPDDDCKYLDGYLAAVDQIFAEDRTIGCVSGHPTAGDAGLGTQWRDGQRDLDAVTVLNRCQEFTVFVRKQSLGRIRYNDLMGVGAKTLWGADEGPDFLIRLIRTGCRLVYFPNLFVYHPDKIAKITRATLGRAASYARGRGCLFRLHRFPRSMVFNSVFRPAAGCGLYLLRLQPMRSAYYFTIIRNTLRGLLMSKAELAEVRENTTILRDTGLRPVLTTSVDQGIESSINASTGQRPVSQGSHSPIEPLALPSLPENPLVSVLIANYNYGRFLPAALDGLLAQTYQNWQAVVCDDGSTDDSVSIAKDYVRRDHRIRLVQKPNGGQTSTVNECYSHLTGDIICFLDSDDIFFPSKLQNVVDAFTANPQAGTCNHFSQVIDTRGVEQSVIMHARLDSGWLANEALIRGGCVYVPMTSCMSMRREIAKLVMPITDKQPRDVDGYLGMVNQFLAPVLVINRPLSHYRVHGNNMGGITEPTPERLRYELKLIELRTGNLKDFVSRRFGSEIARRISIDDNPQYIQTALKKLAIEKADRRRSRASVLIRSHPNAKWRAIWRTVFFLPGPMSRRAVPMMHRSHRIKSFAHRFVTRSKAVPA